MTIPAIAPLIGRRILASALIPLAVSALLFIVLHALPVDPPRCRPAQPPD